MALLECPGRLQQHAQPGTILISETPSRLVEEYVCLEPRTPLTVKVKAEAG